MQQHCKRCAVVPSVFELPPPGIPAKMPPQRTLETCLGEVRGSVATPREEAQEAARDCSKLLQSASSFVALA
eukprot:2046061-Alexandrium_andersonii.AAC.1